MIIRGYLFLVFMAIIIKQEKKSKRQEKEALKREMDAKYYKDRDNEHILVEIDRCEESEKQCGDELKKIGVYNERYDKTKQDTLSFGDNHHVGWVGSAAHLLAMVMQTRDSGTGIGMLAAASDTYNLQSLVHRMDQAYTTTNLGPD